MLTVSDFGISETPSLGDEEGKKQVRPLSGSLSLCVCLSLSLSLFSVSLEPRVDTCVLTHLLDAC